ncbi:MAG: hypothetical protein WCJ51_02265 [Candidatus Moraniibacteriota bacterium]
MWFCNSISNLFLGLKCCYKIGDFVIFKGVAISRCAKADDMLDGLIGRVNPGTRYLVVGKNSRGLLLLEGWVIVSGKERTPLSLNPSALKKC